MTCRELIEFLADYLEGSLPSEQRAVFEQHLGICSQCVTYLDTYRKTIQLERAALCDEAQVADPPEDLVRAILAARRA